MAITILDQRAQQLERGVSKIDWDLDQIERGGFDHFMLKEIFEQPATIENCMRGRLLPDEGTSKLGGLNMTDEELLKFDNIVITACGTSWHSALIGEHMLEELARIPVEVEYASEFRYRNPIVNDKTLCIVISQSGETADTLAAMREAKIARRAHLWNRERRRLDDRARERRRHLRSRRPGDRSRLDEGVHQPGDRARCSSRSSSARLRNLSMVRRQGDHRGAADASRPRSSRFWIALPEIEKIAEEFKRAQNFLYLGRGYNFPTALEGALKLKEISYIHAEGYPAAEMKHGPIALIDEKMPVVFVTPHDSVFDKVVSNVQEVKARERQGDRDHDPRRGGAGRKARLRVPDPGDERHADAGARVRSRSSCWRTTSPSSAGRTSISRAISPSPSRWSSSCEFYSSGSRGQKSALAIEKQGASGRVFSSSSASRTAILRRRSTGWPRRHPGFGCSAMPRGK